MKREDTREDDLARSVICPTCSANVGDDCAGISGKRVPIHGSRAALVLNEDGSPKKSRTVL